MKYLIEITALSLLFFSCNTTLKRYNSIRDSKVDNTLVSINLVSAKVNKSGSTSSYKSVFDLQGRGQEAVLKDKTLIEQTSLLNKKFLSKSSNKNGVLDYSKREVQLIYSIDRKVSFDYENFTLHDRIEDLSYSLKLTSDMPEDVDFISWNKYVTEYGTLNIGSLEYNQGFNSNLNLEGKIGANIESYEKTENKEVTKNLGPEVSLGGNVGYSRSVKENQDLKRRFVQLSGVFNKDSLKVHQQGSRETELAGNVSINVTIQLPKDEEEVYNFSNLFDKNNNINSPDKIGLSTQWVIIPDLNKLKQGIKVDLKYNYAIRHIISGHHTFAEFDDNIRYILGSGSKSNITLLTEDELKVPLYAVVLDNESLLSSIDNKTVYFKSYAEARNFKIWLQIYVRETPSPVMKFGDYTVYFKKFKDDMVGLKKVIANIEVKKVLNPK